MALSQKDLAKKRYKHEARRKAERAARAAEDLRLARGDRSIIFKRRRRFLNDNRKHHRLQGGLNTRKYKAQLEQINGDI